MVTQVNLAGMLAIFADIFQQSKLIAGRFCCLSSAVDINTTNFGQIVTDAFSGLDIKQKFPAALLLPPYKVKKNDQRGWAKYRMELYFFVLDRRNANNDVKNSDTETDISLQTYQNDWNDTNIISDQFFMALVAYCQAGGLTPYLHEDKAVRQTRFIKGAGNDKVNGCKVEFDMSMWEGDNCNAITDYPVPLVVNVTDFAPNTLTQQIS